jgi:very-short-patch-repair endonuclease
MKDVLRKLAAAQAGCVAVWQLRNAGWSRSKVRHGTRGLRELHDGVYVTGDAPITRLQRWWAAALTAPGSFLAFASAGAAHEIRPWEATFEVIVRQGSGGPRRQDGLLICRTKHLHTTTLDGLPITTAERTVADLWPRLSEKDRAKTLRNAIRLKRLTPSSLAAHLRQASARQRPHTLSDQLARHANLKLHRCRSDAEALAVVTLADAKLPAPQINHRIAGEEADLSWPDRRFIIEIDGGTYHQDKLEDARKTAIWRAAGWDVERLPADVVYDDPPRLIRAARQGS